MHVFIVLHGIVQIDVKPKFKVNLSLLYVGHLYKVSLKKETQLVNFLQLMIQIKANILRFFIFSYVFLHLLMFSCKNLFH